MMRNLPPQANANTRGQQRAEQARRNRYEKHAAKRRVQVVIPSMKDLRKADRRKHPGKPRPDEVILTGVFTDLARPFIADAIERDTWVLVTKGGTVIRNPDLLAALRDVMTLHNTVVTHADEVDE
jgi:hypothetical protein